MNKLLFGVIVTTWSMLFVWGSTALATSPAIQQQQNMIQQQQQQFQQQQTGFLLQQQNNALIQTQREMQAQQIRRFNDTMHYNAEPSMEK